MNNKQTFDFYAKIGIGTFTAEQRIKILVDMLIDALYVPIMQKTDGGNINQVDPKRIKHFGIDKEPINWGDLKCCEVNLISTDKWEVVIDEAAPGECPTLCEYVEKYMQSYGWDVSVSTCW